MTIQLPIIAHLSEIRESLTVGNVVLSAAPGAGKSTALLLDLLRHFPTEDKKILVLQPRRVIVRALSNYLSEQIGEPVGQRVGYQIRGETKVSKHTKLEFVTEAILTRRLQNDPELSDVAVVVFDEFHERSVHSDFGLALAMESQSALREDLRLLVMSATLDMQSLIALMPEAKHRIVEGRQFPITYDYCPMHSSTNTNRSNARFKRDALEHFVSSIVAAALDNYSEDILVFMPSVRSIQLTCGLVLKRLNQHSHSPQVDVLPLYGALSRAEQQRAITASAKGVRKVVIATNVAETSLTIEGVGVVIDSGLERRLEIDLRTGIEGLVTKPISQASAYQRAGRAGRLAAGHCYRLWSQESHSRMAEQSPPEITQCDVSDLVLHALAWGTQLSDLPLLTQPTSAQLAAAEQQLIWLDAIDDQGMLTRHGSQLLQYASSLRLAHMQIVVAQHHPQSSSWAHAAVGISTFLDSDKGKPNHDIVSAYLGWLDSVDRITYSRMEKSLQRQSIIASKHEFKAISLKQIATCLALTFPDWVACHLGQGKYKLANGKQGVISKNDIVENSQWLSIGGLRQSDTGTIQITLHQPIDDDLVQALIAPQYVIRSEMVWNDQKERFQRFEQTLFGEIVVQQRPLPLLSTNNGQEASVRQSWSKVITKKGFSWLPLSKAAAGFLCRCQIASRLCQRPALMPFSDFSEQALMSSLDEWLTPYLDNAHSFADLKQIDWQQLLSHRLEWEQQQWIKQHLPNQYELPTGDKVKLDYSQVVFAAGELKKGPVVAARMQLLFGLQVSPTLAEGRLPITFELLSPAQRPLQTTRDLTSFWRSDSYTAIKKEMKGRYPKHLWPDDPANTLPTHRTKKYSH